jgi:hypothetical protein
VDNGYHNISCTIPPFKAALYNDEHFFSEWIESTRKDVECTFGIMKGRFLVFNSPIRFHGIDIIDKIWLTCCALHNMLLESNQRNNRDNNDNVQNYLDLPDPEIHDIQYRIVTPNEFADDEEFADATYPNGCGITIPIKSLNMNTFRSRLVRHFTICKINGLATWDEPDEVDGNN